MNDASPLPVLASDAARWPRRYQRVDLVLRGDEVDGDPRPAAVLSENEAAEQRHEDLAAALDRDFPDAEGGPSEEFLRLWTDAGAQEDETHEARQASLPFSMRALQGAVIANGAALVALALVMAGPDSGSRTGLMASAIVLALGLIFAAISVVAASLDFGGAQLRIARVATSSRLATISGAVSYAALVLEALPLI